MKLDLEKGIFHSAHGSLNFMSSQSQAITWLEQAGANFLLETKSGALNYCSTLELEGELMKIVLELDQTGLSSFSLRSTQGHVGGKTMDQISLKMLKQEFAAMAALVMRTLGREADQKKPNDLRWKQPWGVIQVLLYAQDFVYGIFVCKNRD
jgi:hypothetical protein